MNQDTRQEQEAEDRVKQHLLEIGLLTEITPPLPPHLYPKNREAPVVEGNAVSELLMGERR